MGAYLKTPLLAIALLPLLGVLLALEPAQSEWKVLEEALLGTAAQAAPGSELLDPPAGADEQATVARWRWLKGTTWYVPTRNPLGFFLADAKTVVPVVDQTVYQIYDYREGFFWGKLVKKLTGNPPSCLSVIGSVTPEGWIQMSLVTQDPQEEAVVSRGTGIMRRKRGEWTMEWQGASGPSAASQYSHWAYMVQTRPGLPSWNRLPFVDMSVEQFLAQCPEDGPRLVEPPAGGVDPGR